MSPNTIPRSAGILLHPSSLPTPFGIGDLGSAAYEFVKFLRQAGQTVWQVLPIGPTGYGDSPYQCLSAFAGNPLLIAPDGLISMQLLTQDEVMACFMAENLKVGQKNDFKQWETAAGIDYEGLQSIKNQMLKIAFQHFMEGETTTFKTLHGEFREFCEAEKGWLDNFVIFYSLKRDNGMKAWVEWPKNYAQFHANTIRVYAAGHHRDLEFYKFIQWVLFDQWMKLKKFANQNEVQIMGDMPIFVAHDSADVWAHRDLFTVNKQGTLEFQAGVPPDYFSATGQLWGNPLFRWDKLEEQEFDWLIGRIKHLMRIMDWIRIDHFRGFEAYWQIPAKETTAINGKWVKAPGMTFFTKLQEKLGALPIMAEDLGVITPEVDALREAFNFPGMRVLQFGFGGTATNPHLVHNFVPNCVAYTGTHDNNTTLGWWLENATVKEKEHFKTYFNSEGMEVNLELIKGLYRSVANLAIIPIQDVLGYDSNGRMNTPSKAEGNWQFRLKYGELTKQKAVLLKDLTSLYGRAPQSKEERSL